MGSRSQRRSDRLFSNSTKLSLVIGFALIWLFLSTTFDSSPQAPAAPSNSSANSNPDERDVASLQQNSSDKAAAKSVLTEPVKNEIESLFAEVEKNPEAKDKILRQLRLILHETFAGQEDCWSCEGVVYFDKFDQIAGRGQSRKPFGFREWLDEGDDAYQSQKLDKARKYYSQALQVMDERSIQDEDSVDNDTLERLRNRCKELGCR